MMTFAEKLRTLMVERGIGTRELARLIPYDKGNLSRVVNGRKPPSEKLAACLDEILGADGELAALRPSRRPRRRGARATLPSPSMPAIGHHGPVAPELVGYFRQQLPGHYRADMWLGPHMLIPTVAAQTQLIQQLIQAAETQVRRGLLEMGVAYSALLGWLYQDAADLTQSAHWRSVALDMAHRTGDPQLISYALANKAMHAVDLENGTAIIDYAEAALDNESRLAPKVRVLARVHLAHGYGFIGDREAVDLHLDHAQALLDRIDDEYPWGNACRRTPNYIDIQRATAYGRAGAYDDAAQLWDQILGDQPEDFRRDTGVFWARQAGVLAAARKPKEEKVVQIASIAATKCDETGSERLRGELVAIPKYASAWADSRHGRALAEIIASVS